MTDHKTFCAFGAYAVDVTNPRATVVLPLANAGELGKPIDVSRLLTLDLQQRLGVPGVTFDNAILDTMGVEKDDNKVVPLEAQPAFVEDNRINVLTVGPVFPGAHIGGIYIERNQFFSAPVALGKPSIRRLIDPNPANKQWPDPPRHTYEFMSSALREGNTISRYHGFHATVASAIGSKKVLSVKGTKIRSFDMHDRSLCDDPAFLFEQIQDPDHPESPELALHADSQVGDEGAIFLSLEFCLEIGLHSPKEPPGGGDSLVGDFRPDDDGSPQTPGSVVSVPTITTNASCVNVGAPRSDSFTKSVFERGLTSANAQKIVIEATELASLRGRLMEFVRKVKSNNNSLDIIADAPGGTQRVGRSTVLTIMHDDDAGITSDDELVSLIRDHFTQCRLLGCYTAGCNSAFPFDQELRRRMHSLADLLRIPVIGTMRAIAYPDFDDLSFREASQINGVTQKIVIKIRPEDPFIQGIRVSVAAPAPMPRPFTAADERAQDVSDLASRAPRKGSAQVQVDDEQDQLIASGRLQRDWLAHYEQVKVEAGDVEPEESIRVPVWQMPDDFFGSTAAATDRIDTAPVGVVALAASGMRVRAEVLASATLLRLSSKRYGSIYVNIPPTDRERGTWLAQNHARMAADPDAGESAT
jgi:hypothetical protein